MKIELTKITIKELIKGFEDDDDNGVFGYDGNLDIRPPYQREFIYDEPEQRAVIDSIMNGFPLNSMYWAVRAGNKGKERKFEVLDGQQRTLSICGFGTGDLVYNDKYFASLTSDEKKKFLNYKLNVYQCSGTESEELAWFKTVNIAGKALSSQEIRNSVHPCQWLSDAKSYFSKKNPPARNKGGHYMKGDTNRQGYLETVIRWHALSIGNNEEYKDIISGYMSERKKKGTANAEELILYFEAIIDWVENIFGKPAPKTNPRSEMKGRNWGVLYNEHKNDKNLDPIKIRAEVAELMRYEEVFKRGIYEYVITREKRYLQPRTFENNIKRAVYERQNGICNNCKKEFDIKKMQADHIQPWIKDGKTTPENCQMLCVKCNQEKSDKC